MKERPRKNILKAPSNALKLCHLADLHLGYRRFNKITASGFNQREVDVNQAFHEALERIVVLQPQVLLIPGDVFHAVRPSNAVLAYAFRELRNFTERLKCPVIISAGNHESPRRADSGSALRLLAEIEGVYVADTNPERFNFPELSLSVCCLPHPSLVNLSTVQLRADERFKFNVLCVHAQIGSRWVSDFGGASLSLSDLAAHEWDYIALGHVHAREELALNAAYSGSIEHTSTDFWQEGDRRKGFLEIELPGAKSRFHVLSSPREVVQLAALEASGLRPEEIMGRLAERMEAVPGGIEGKILRIVVRGISREAQRQLDFRQIRKWRTSALNLTIDFKLAARSGAEASRVQARGRLEDEFSAFCRDWEPQGVELSAVQETLKTFLHRLEVQDEASKPQS